MTTSVDPSVEIYDEFTGPALDRQRWDFLEMPQPDGPAYVCAEAGAVTEVGEGALRVTVERFTKSHDTVQPMDNVKNLLLSTAEFDVAQDGTTQIHGEISARNINARPRDYRDGFASLVTIDLATGSVFDIGVTNDNVFAIYEQLPFASVDASFTYIVEEPLLGLETRPDRFYRCRIVFDARASEVSYYVDDHKLFATAAVIPHSVRIGLGMFTLQPLARTGSRSLRGQGLAAVWRNVGATPGAVQPVGRSR